MCDTSWHTVYGKCRNSTASGTSGFLTTGLFEMTSVWFHLITKEQERNGRGLCSPASLETMQGVRYCPSRYCKRYLYCNSLLKYTLTCFHRCDNVSSEQAVCWTVGLELKNMPRFILLYYLIVQRVLINYLEEQLWLWACKSNDGFLFTHLNEFNYFNSNSLYCKCFTQSEANKWTKKKNHDHSTFFSLTA